ncbi:nucleoside-diphosphate kinase [archaeon]|jgi:nucleoside-diphosphate kinase|nr:nucleoside-diphosphate kinase [archaeon]MBT4021833.1 nucleoside-diphosphate kinase [archaeon]MBT4272128.1 nucleoside-diphosphate kinase [archaeon]MBT4460309.1 nucleoside-diphosphate kinase [archaeon]MBT4858933.1 nucleoside-diphosphate kinase [archaeon]
MPESLIQRTLVLLKPDAVQRGIMGNLITRFENAGLKIVGMKMVWVDDAFSKKHYSAHVEKPFYKGLEEFITFGPLVALAIEGIEAIETIRKMVGSTEPKKALPGTIRGDFAHHSYPYADKKGIAIKNLIHASDSIESANKELNLWFTSEELHTYKTVHELHVF